MRVTRRDFPEGFLFGAATSAYQIEGHAYGGAGSTHWDTFAATPGNVVDAEDGRVACDHYHRWESDLDLLVAGNFDVYRFSTSWARVMPEGRGAPNPEGLDFYDRLVDGMLARGLKPAATLYHWELPSAIADLGGWTNRDTTGWFADFAEVIMGRIGDRVWSAAPINEPWCVSWLSHFLGIHAPGLRDIRAAARAMHHVLLGHGRAIGAMRGAGDAEPRRRLQLRVGDAGRRQRRRPRPQRRATTRSTIASSCPASSAGPIPTRCWRGSGRTCPRAGRTTWPRSAARSTGWAPTTTPASSSPPTTGPGRPTAASRGRCPRPRWAGRSTPRACSRSCGTATRTRAACRSTSPRTAWPGTTSWPTARVEDRERIDYLERHLEAVRTAIAEGIPVAGYFAWSLLDNYEWAIGYGKRFGIVHVDFETLERTPKASFEALRRALGAMSGDVHPGRRRRHQHARRDGRRQRGGEGLDPALPQRRPPGSRRSARDLPRRDAGRAPSRTVPAPPSRGRCTRVRAGSPTSTGRSTARSSARRPARAPSPC